MEQIDKTEEMIFINTFGAITSKRIILDYKTEAEEVPLNELRSVSIQHRRNTVLAKLGFAMGLAALLYLVTQFRELSQGEVIISMLLVLAGGFSGISSLIGYPCIVISGPSGSKPPLIVSFGQVQNARQFVNEIVKVMARKYYSSSGIAGKVIQ